MSRRRFPRPAAAALRAAAGRVTPPTPLAAAQGAWREAAGEAIAEVTEPIGERDGLLVIRCSSAVWAEELRMMEPALLERLAEILTDGAPAGLRFEVAGPSLAG